MRELSQALCRCFSESANALETFLRCQGSAGRSDLEVSMIDFIQRFCDFIFNSYSLRMKDVLIDLNMFFHCGHDGAEAAANATFR